MMYEELVKELRKSPTNKRLMNNPYPICENCIFVDEPLDKDPCHECNRAFLAQRIKPNFVSKHKPQTNADRIRAMTDEELAKWLCVMNFDDCPDKAHQMKCTDKCYECWLDWLKSPVEVET